MITASFGLTATERVLPKLALDFTTAILDSRVTFTRSGNTATYTNPSGVITAINANLPRFDYNPTTLACQGLLIEEARTNLLLNSLIDGTSLTTQSVTVAATAYTLSFYGTGRIDLSGTHTATVTGTGAYPSRKTYTFTPTAGALTLTVSGTVQYAQLEAGAFATSYIPTTSAALTRNADVATMTGTNFSDWYNASEGTLKVTADTLSVAANSKTPTLASLYTSSTSIMRFWLWDGAPTLLRWNGLDGGTQFDLTSTAISANTVFSVVGTYKANSFAISVNAANPSVDTSGTVPSITAFNIGSISGGTTQFWNGHIANLSYWPQRLTNAEVQAFSK